MTKDQKDMQKYVDAFMSKEPKKSFRCWLGFHDFNEIVMLDSNGTKTRFCDRCGGIVQVPGKWKERGT